MANVTGNGKDNHLTGTSHADVIKGLGGDDRIAGYEGADTLFGGGGDDTLNGGYGDDTVNGGKGLDVADYYYATADMTADLDKGVVRDGGDVDHVTSIEEVWFGSGDDTVSAARSGTRVDLAGGDDVFKGLGGDDWGVGGGGNDRISTGGGDDTLTGGLGNDRLDGGKGFDIGDFQTNYEATETRAVDADLASGVATRGGERDTLDGIEALYSGNGDDRLGGDDRANLFAALGGDDLIEGRGGADTIYGEAGDDSLAGGDGADKLIGGKGNDAMIGGAGADRFIFDDGAGFDGIGDFGDGKDKIDLSFVSGVDSIKDLDIRQDGGNVVVDFGKGEILLVDTAVADIDAKDFVF